MEFETVIRRRRSIRRYEDHKVTEAKIQKLLQAAMAAPVSNKKYQDIYLTVIQKRGVLDQIQELVGMDNVFYGAGTVIVVSSKEQTVAGIKEFNTACIIENMLLEAANLGLGSIYLSYFLTKLEHKNELSELLGIPQEYEPVSACGVGYITEEDALTERNDLEGRIKVNYIQ